MVYDFYQLIVEWDLDRGCHLFTLNSSRAFGPGWVFQTGLVAIISQSMAASHMSSSWVVNSLSIPVLSFLIPNIQTFQFADDLFLSPLYVPALECEFPCLTNVSLWKLSWIKKTCIKITSTVGSPMNQLKINTFVFWGMKWACPSSPLSKCFVGCVNLLMLRS